MLAAMILTLPACGSGPEAYWKEERFVEEEALEDVRYEETLSQGKLKLRVTQKTRVSETPVEGKYLLLEETYSDFDCDHFGLVFFSRGGRDRRSLLSVRRLCLRLYR